MQEGSRAIILAAIFLLLVLWMQHAKRDTSLCFDSHGDLLTGYKILRHTLKKESQLKYLKKLRQATFRAPKGEVDRLMTLIYEISYERGCELEELWVQFEPLIDTTKTPLSVIGSSIQNTAESKGAAELISKLDKSWSTRFFFLQAMATRMVASLALSTADKEPNVERKQWLWRLAAEYEGIREELVHVLTASCDCPNKC